VVVVEELDPHLETHVKALGIRAQGKELIPIVGELDPRIVRQAITGEAIPVRAPEPVPSRPPNLCPGCPHRGLFFALKKLKVTVTGDIGCYTLATLPPLGAMDTCICMGASIGNAHGMEKALGQDGAGKVVAVIGDSTFLHSGVTGLMNVVYNRGISTVILLDNDITAMTGAQENPATGKTLHGEPTRRTDLPALCRALGVEHVYTVNPHDMKQTEAVLRREVARPEPSVIITKAPCALLPDHRRKKRPVYEVIADLCTGCKACSRLGCPAIEWVPFTPGRGGRRGEKGDAEGDGADQPAAVRRVQPVPAAVQVPGDSGEKIMIVPKGDVFLAGVGGQGTLLASEVLCDAFLLSGFDVKKSEVHGMAQRGGSVTTHLRFGPKVFSPLIEPGKADLLVAFEKIEALRFAHYLRTGGAMVVNAQEIFPPSVATGQERYPQDVTERLRAVTDRLHMVDALAVALSMREVRAVNIVLMGAASHFLPLPEAAYEEAMKARLPEKIVDVNVRAFRAGRKLLAVD